MMILLITATLWISHASSERYEPNWDSLDKRPLPAWYDDAKLGIFMHWGVYSVPSYTTEWFWYYWQGVKRSTEVDFMNQNFAPNFTYANFAPKFTAEFFDADAFAEIVKMSGARYFVLTSKHHEGFTMYPSKYSWNWNSMDVGPHRDIVGELSKAIRKAGLKFGLYYSLFEWFNRLYLEDKASVFASNEYVQMVVKPQLSEIINIYKPEVLWSDGDWEASWQYWNATNFLAWLYNDSPVKDTIVTNDRWGVGTTCKHGDFWTCSDRFLPGSLMPKKWENCLTIDKYSWGYRRPSRYSDYMTVDQLVAQLAETISCGGNMLLNVGPTHDGRIGPIFEERLVQFGKFVRVADEAIFGSKPWICQNDTLTKNVWYTSKLQKSNDIRRYSSKPRLYNKQSFKDTIVYAFVLKWPQNGTVLLGCPKATNSTTVTLLGYPGPIRTQVDPATKLVAIDFTSIDWTQLADGARQSFVFKLTHLQSDCKAKPKMLNDNKQEVTVVQEQEDGDGRK